MSKKSFFWLVNIILFLFLTSCRDPKTPDVDEPVQLNITNVEVDNNTLYNNTTVYNISITHKSVLKITFDKAIDISKSNSSMLTFSGELNNNYTVSASEDKKTLIVNFNILLKEMTEYSFSIKQGDNLGGYVYPDFNAKFFTEIDPTPKFPTITDEELLTLVQKQTFKFFWDYAHPVSGLTRERLGSGDIVTIGGSGFGVMTILVGIERGFITRQEGLERLNTIVTFLDEKAEKLHGAFSHWLNGSTGKIIPFSTNDDGADLVETAYMIEGLITVKQYFINGNEAEKSLCNKIDKICDAVEWNWFRKETAENVLYWHWSKEKNWIMNMPIRGWNECLITYILAAASPTYSIPKNVYDNGWAKNGAIKNGGQYYGVTLPLGENLGGPMFFAHYSFLGLDPRNLSDDYANYWTQNTAHAKINYNYCVANPKRYFGYSADCWGLTASDIPAGYTASSPSNDISVIAPTAALASFPYTPTESMKALKYFYYILGDKIWGNYGFVDAFSLKERWFAKSYISIDQGPIIIMIENYRTGLLWNLFMKDENVRNGLTKLGFKY